MVFAMILRLHASHELIYVENTLQLYRLQAWAKYVEAISVPLGYFLKIHIFICLLFWWNSIQSLHFFSPSEFSPFLDGDTNFSQLASVLAQDRKIRYWSFSNHFGSTWWGIWVLKCHRCYEDLFGDIPELTGTVRQTFRWSWRWVTPLAIEPTPPPSQVPTQMFILFDFLSLSKFLSCDRYFDTSMLADTDIKFASKSRYKF